MVGFIGEEHKVFHQWMSSIPMMDSIGAMAHIGVVIKHVVDPKEIMSHGLMLHICGLKPISMSNKFF